MELVNSIDTLTINQLLMRWPNYSRTNIFELANKANFGIYVNPLVKKKTYYNINKSMEKLITAKFIPKEELESYIELNNKFLDFLSTKAFLLEKKHGYVRLPTATEVEIFPLCDTSAIQRMIEYQKIHFLDFNNTFGFTKFDDECIAESYFLIRTPYFFNKEQHPVSFTDNDICVFIEQIKAFEDANPIVLEQIKLIQKNHLSDFRDDGIQCSTEPFPEQNVFSRCGEGYEIIYQGEKIILASTKGVQYIEYLIKNPNKEIHVNDLSLICGNVMDNVTDIKSEDFIDQNMHFSNSTSESCAQIKPSQIKLLSREIENLKLELDRAEKDNDKELIDELKEQKNQIEDYLKKSTYNGRPRNFVDDGERRRQAINKAITAVLKKIQKFENKLYHHLDKCLKIGYSCVYIPDSNTRWINDISEM